MKPMQAMKRMKREGRNKPERGPGRGFSPLPPMERGGMQPSAAEAIAVSWRENEEGHIVGDCKGCGATVRAMGLVPVPDRMLFGELKEGGWYCSQCKPREFGKVSGRPALAIPGMEGGLA